MEQYILREEKQLTNIYYENGEQVKENIFPKETREDNYKLKSKGKIIKDYFQYLGIENDKIECENKKTREIIKLADRERLKEWLKQSMEDIEKWNYIFTFDKTAKADKECSVRVIVKRIITIERA